ncbi:MAG: MFS transporter, partial [Pseudomonadota bacterium]
MQDRVATVHQAFLTRTAAGDLPQGAPPVPGLPADRARAIFRAQCRSRALDRISREMQRAGTGFYTIGSSGHEGMAAVAA